MYRTVGWSEGIGNLRYFDADESGELGRLDRGPYPYDADFEAFGRVRELNAESSVSLLNGSEEAAVVNTVARLMNEGIKYETEEFVANEDVIRAFVSAEVMKVLLVSNPCDIVRIPMDGQFNLKQK